MTFETRLAIACSVAMLMGSGFGSAEAQGIYTCVDANGRKITSDRPIAECMDRAQKEMNPSGTVKRVLAPPPTAKDMAKQEEKEKADEQTRIQQTGEKRLDLALLTRYPDRASHDKQRTAALEVVNDVIKMAAKRLHDLGEQRKSINAELDPYKISSSKIPPAINRRLDEADNDMAVQKRLIADQEAEKYRTIQRFDSEMDKLKPHWGLPATPVVIRTDNNAKNPSNK